VLKNISALILSLSLFLGAALPAYSHHAASSEFNTDKTMQIKGVLTSIEWINPHAFLHFDVVGPDGRTTNWAMLLACLLYTSPSPRDLSTSRMPSSA